MPENQPDQLSEVTDKIAPLLKTLEEAQKDEATIEVHRKAFELGCELLTVLVRALDRKNSVLTELAAQTSAFDIGIPENQFKTFLDQEERLLKRLKFSPAIMRRTMERLNSAEAVGVPVSRFSAAEVINALSEFRDVLCAIEVLTKRSFKVTPKLVRVCADAVIDVGIIAGDTIGVSVAGSGAIAANAIAWPLVGVALVAVGSIRAG